MTQPTEPVQAGEGEVLFKTYAALKWVSIVLAIGSTASALTLAFLDEKLFRTVHSEDAWVEWTGVAALLLAGLLGLAWFIGLRLKTGQWRLKRHWFYLFAFVFGVLCAGEEISYGQRLLGFETSEFFNSFNAQKEVNVHNVVQEVVFNVKTKHIAGLVFLIYGVIVPLMIRYGKARPSGAEWIGLPFPPYFLVPLWICGLILVIDFPTGFEEETAETLYAVGLVIFMLFEGLRLFRPGLVPNDAAPPTGPLPVP